MKRGELWWSTLSAPNGSGPGLRRPVVIVQANPFNDSRIQTVMVAIVTSNLKLAASPGNVRVSRTDSGLPKPSVVNVSQLFTVDRGRLNRKVRALPASTMQAIDDGLRLVLALP
jgi:mRNA interferase MazF